MSGSIVVKHAGIVFTASYGLMWVERPRLRLRGRRTYLRVRAAEA